MPKHTLTGLMALIKEVLPQEPGPSLLSFLDKLRGLGDAPASGALRYHHAYPGGLVDHIIDTYQIANDLSATQTVGSPVPRPTAIDLLLVAVLHDIHKVQDAIGTSYYQPNILKSGKRSEAEPFEHNSNYLKSACVSDTAEPTWKEVMFLHREGVDKMPGGVKSLALISALAPDLYAHLGEEVLYTIRYHDGAYGHNKYELAGKETPLMILFHAADMLSSRLNRIAK